MCPPALHCTPCCPSPRVVTVHTSPHTAPVTSTWPSLLPSSCLSCSQPGTGPLASCAACGRRGCYLTSDQFDLTAELRLTARQPPSCPSPADWCQVMATTAFITNHVQSPARAPAPAGAGCCFLNLFALPQVFDPSLVPAVDRGNMGSWELGSGHG